MNILKKLLVAVTTMGLLALFVPVNIVAQVQNPHIAVLTDSASGFTTAGSVSHSFAGDRLLMDATSTQVAGMTLADITMVADSTSMQPDDADTAGSLPGAASTLNNAIDDVSGVVDPDDPSKSHSGTSGWHTDAGFLFSIAEVPEPADWMTLLCGLVVVAFMARRTNGPFAD